MRAGASVCSKGGDSAAFFEPPRNGVARNAEDTADAAQGGAFVVGPKNLFLTSRIVSGAGGILHEATPAIAAAVALLAPGGIAMSYDVGAGAMLAVRSLYIRAFYYTSTTDIDPLPKIELKPIKKEWHRDEEHNDEAAQILDAAGLELLAPSIPMRCLRRNGAADYRPDRNSFTCFVSARLRVRPPRFGWSRSCSCCIA